MLNGGFQVDPANYVSGTYHTPLATKDAAYCTNFMEKLGLGEMRKCALPQTRSPAALYVPGNHMLRSRAKYVALRLFFNRDIIQEDTVSTLYVRIIVII